MISSHAMFQRHVYLYLLIFVQLLKFMFIVINFCPTSEIRVQLLKFMSTFIHFCLTSEVSVLFSKLLNFCPTDRANEDERWWANSRICPCCNGTLYHGCSRVLSHYFNSTICLSGSIILCPGCSRREAYEDPCISLV